MKTYFRKSVALVVTVAMALAIAGGCAPSFREVRGTRVTDVERECDRDETPPCFETREAPAGSTREDRSSWCSDHSGLCIAAILGGVAAVGFGAAALTGQLTPEPGQGGRIETQGMQPGGAR